MFLTFQNKTEILPKDVNTRLHKQKQKRNINLNYQKNLLFGINLYIHLVFTNKVSVQISRHIYLIVK